MASTRQKNNLEKKELLDEINHDAAILIVEDDVDQLNLLVSLVVNEIKSFLKDERVNRAQRKKLTPINLLKVSELKSLQQAAITHRNVVLVLLDCNIPDVMGAPPHDQFVKNDKHIVTGQHKSVDIIAHNLPGTPITLTSSLGRFQRTITQYYRNDKGLNIEFVGKDEISRIQQSIRKHIRGFVGGVG